MTDSELRQGRGYVPNPYETTPPTSSADALEDYLRYVSHERSRAEAVEIIKNVDPSKIVLALQGRPTGSPLTRHELEVATVFDYCIQKQLLKTPAQAIGTIISVKFEVEDGGVFVGEERARN